MLQRWIKVILFFSSYSPLLFIFALQNPFNNRIVQFTLFGVGVVSIAVLWVVLAQTKEIEGYPEKVAQVNFKDGESMSYIVTYLLPFLSLKFDTVENILAILLLFVMLAILYMNSNLIYTNPILNLFGYHIYEVQVEGGRTIMLLSKRNQILLDEELAIIQMDNNIYIE